MNKETIEILRVLADKLGTTSEYLWQALITQAFIYGSLELFFLVVLLGGSAWWVKFARHKIKEFDCYRDYELLELSIWVAVLLCAFLAPFSIYGAVTAFINPEYWALREILRK